jgi:hypothetical protein
VRVSIHWSTVTGTLQARWQRATAGIVAPMQAAMARVQQIAARGVSNAWARLPAWVRGPLSQGASMACQDFGRVVRASMAAMQRIRASWTTLGPVIGRTLQTSMRRAFAAVRAAGMATFTRLRSFGTAAMSRIARAHASHGAIHILSRVHFSSFFLEMRGKRLEVIPS